MREIFEQFRDIVKDIESFSCIERYGFNFTRMVVRFNEGSSLRVWEKGSGNRLDRYSYYWLDGLDNLIVGWDNAPHHKDLETFPNHKHKGGKVFPATEKLIDVLNHIALRLR